MSVYVDNPQAANKTVTDWRTMKDAAGEGLAGYEIMPFVAGGTIVKGRVVALLPPTSATTKLTVVEKVTARKFASVVGVATKAAVAGDTLEVVISGLAFVSVGAGTPAAGDNATIQGNTGEAGVVAIESDATTIAGTILGTYLGAKVGDLAPVWLLPRGVA